MKSYRLWYELFPLTIINYRSFGLWAPIVHYFSLPIVQTRYHLFNHSAVKGHLGCFLFGDLQIKLLEIFVFQSLVFDRFWFLWDMHKHTMAGPYDRCKFSFLWNWQTFLEWLYHFIFQQHEWSSSFTSLSAYLSLAFFFFFIHSNRCVAIWWWKYFHVFVICLSFLVKCPLLSFDHFIIGTFGFFFYTWVWEFKYILYAMRVLYVF